MTQRHTSNPGLFMNRRKCRAERKRWSTDSKMLGMKSSRRIILVQARGQRFIHRIHTRWHAAGMGSEEVLPNIHPGRNMSSMPSGIVGEVGHYTTDLSAPIGRQTWEAAIASNNVALTATDFVISDLTVNSSAYALCRPPGHHAFKDQAGGFCFLNNIAIAAQFARRTGRQVSAEEGKQLGFVTDIAPPHEAMKVARSWAEKVLECGPLALQATKHVALQGLSTPDIAVACRVEYLPVPVMKSSEDYIEGPRAFSEKRKPNWLGR